MRRWRFQVLAVFTLAFTGCYTFTGTTLPPHLKTIEVEPVVNQTLDPLLAERLTQGIIEGFQSRSKLRRVNEFGQCAITTVLKSYKHEVYNTSGSQVVDYRIDLVAHVKFFDKVKQQMIFEEENLPGFGTYSVEKGQTESDGQLAAVENLVSIILDRTVSGW